MVWYFSPEMKGRMFSLAGHFHGQDQGELTCTNDLKSAEIVACNLFTPAPFVLDDILA